MAIFAIANLKGGVGKTTTAMHLAGTFGRRGLKVLVFDADKQGTATFWSDSAPETSPFPATVTGIQGDGSKIHRVVQRLAAEAGCDHVIVDCAPDRNSPVLGSILTVTDIVLIPVIPSPADVVATGAITSLVEQARGMNPKLRAYLLASLVAANTTLGAQMLAEIAALGIPLLKGKLSYRVADREACAQGTLVQEISGAEKASEEVESLADEVLRIAQQGPEIAEAGEV